MYLMWAVAAAGFVISLQKTDKRVVHTQIVDIDKNAEKTAITKRAPVFLRIDGRF